MKITKYLHSCLLVEDHERVALIDPGKYTFDEKALDVQSIGKLDYLLITHEHPDHLYVPFMQEIVGAFPSVHIIATPSIVEILGKENIRVATEGDEYVEVLDASHERILVPEPQNVLFNVFGKLTHPGDSFDFESSKEILALPVTAPWGHTLQAAEKAVTLKPKIVVPIHDHFWKDWWRVFVYQMLEKYFADRGIHFHGLETGQTIEV